jgi:hypothetical protein
LGPEHSLASACVRLASNKTETTERKATCKTG